MAHHLIIFGDNRASVARVFLLPNTEEQAVYEQMGAPGNYTHLFSIGASLPIDPQQSDNLYASRIKSVLGISTMVELKELGWRPPYMLFESIKQQCRTRWLGRSKEEIESELFDILRQITEAAEDMAKSRFSR